VVSGEITSDVIRDATTPGAITTDENTSVAIPPLRTLARANLTSAPPALPSDERPSRRHALDEPVDQTVTDAMPSLRARERAAGLPSAPPALPSDGRPSRRHALDEPVDQTITDAMPSLRTLECTAGLPGGPPAARRDESPSRQHAPDEPVGETTDAIPSRRTLVRAAGVTCGPPASHSDESAWLQHGLDEPTDETASLEARQRRAQQISALRRSGDRNQDQTFASRATAPPLAAPPEIERASSSKRSGASPGSPRPGGDRSAPRELPRPLRTREGR
jgi:hypothetical protein